MLKKVLLSFVIVLFLFWLSVYAQTENKQNWVEQDKPSIQIQAFNGLRARHCDQWLESNLLTTNSFLTLDAKETKTLCNIFFNEWDTPITINYAYVNAEIWDAGTPNCDINGWKFASLISTSESTSFTIPAHSNIIRYDKMFLPPGMSEWITYGCLWYGISSIETKPGEQVPMFKIENRKVILYNVLIGGQSKIENSVSLESKNSDIYITNKKIKVSTNKLWGIIISATIKNNGNIDQIINLTGKIYNFLWFEKEFSLEEKKIGPHQTVELPILINTIPSYKWFFNFNIFINHKPSLTFTDFNLPAESLKWGFFYEIWMFFVFSRYIIWIGILILLILWLLVKNILPRRKKEQFFINNK